MAVILAWSLKTEITVGELLTSLSILISLVALLRAWAQDRKLRTKEQADKVRTAAARTLAKLERWQEISLWLYTDVEPLFIEVSRMLVEDFDDREKRLSNTIAARDFLWKGITEARIASNRKVLEEDVQVAYVDLYGYTPQVYELVVTAINSLKVEEVESFANFLHDTQQDVQLFEDAEGPYHTAMLGNALRTTASRCAATFQDQTNAIVRPVREFLGGLISESDRDIVNHTFRFSAQASSSHQAAVKTAAPRDDDAAS